MRDANPFIWSARFISAPQVSRLKTSEMRLAEKAVHAISKTLFSL
jgi:hypothetical protein